MITFSTGRALSCGQLAQYRGHVEPEPDTKDWTWTLTRRCDECGLSAGEVGPTEIAERAFLAAEEWVQILRSSPAVTQRPEPAVWSPLEYGAHVRDVFELFDSRLALMLSEETAVGHDPGWGWR